MEFMTEERVDDLAVFYNHVVNSFIKKGLSLGEVINILTLMICEVAKKEGITKEVIFMTIDNYWNNLEEMLRENESQ